MCNNWPLFFVFINRKKNRGLKILKKYLIQLLLIMSIFCSTLLPSYAESADKAEGTIFQPYWTEISQFNNNINITSSGSADIESTILAFSVDLIKVEVHLQQLMNGSWTTIKTWTGTSQDEVCSVIGSWYVQKGYFYRLVSTGTVYSGGQQVEQANYTSQSKWY